MSWCGGACCLRTYELPWIRAWMKEDHEYKKMFADAEYVMDWMECFFTIGDERGRYLHNDYYLKDDHIGYYKAINDMVEDMRHERKLNQEAYEHEEAKRLSRNEKRREAYKNKKISKVVR